MYSVFKKEISFFFSSILGYIVIGVFILVNSLLLWISDSDYNILNSGFADLSSFFTISPLLFLILIPAITMNSFSQEKISGTIEILKTKPISDLHIIIGKFTASILLFIIALLPSLIYVCSIYNLSFPIGNIEYGTIIGGYMGLLLLAGMYISIGLCCSSFFKNNIVSFLVTIFICSFMFYGFENLQQLISPNNQLISLIGGFYHYKNIGIGILDSRDIVYFGIVCYIFIHITFLNFKNE
ncbi:MAG: ABC transporter permease [Flavobacteriaceae bacterium]|nr:ABC transporter permease [Flavobacteriaceae bacterium]